MSEQCGAYRYGKARCGQQSKQMAMGILPLCQSHLVTLQRELRAAEDKGLRQAFSKYIDSKIVEARDRRDASLVYFIQAGRRVKIGQSLNPHRRLATIRSGYGTKSPKGLDTSRAKLVATEPGGQPREYELHQQFAHLRVAGEWFNHSGELKDYITSLDQHQLF